jgi:hypothetical protein
VVEETTKPRVVSQSELALTENDASSDFDEADFGEEDEEVQLIEENSPSDADEELESLANSAVYAAISKAVMVREEEEVEKELDEWAERTVDAVLRENVQAADQVVVVIEPVVGDLSVISDLKEVAVVGHSECVTVEYVEESGDGAKSSLNESSNEAFEIRYEYLDSEVEEVMDSSGQKGAVLMQAESEIDISNLELRFSQAMEESSPLIKILCDIEQEIDNVS